jgi:hypothetical protein
MMLIGEKEVLGKIAVLVQIYPPQNSHLYSKK